MLKKIIITVLLFVLYVPLSFAGVDIEILSNKSLVQENENFTLNIKVTSDLKKDLNIEKITGIENFNLVSQGKSFNRTNINGVVTIETSLQFVLNTEKSGEYVFGPVILDDQEQKYYSNILTISVKKELLNITPEEIELNPTQKIKFSYKNFLYSPTFILILVILIVSIYLLVKTKNVQEDDIENEIDKTELIKNELNKLKNSINDITKNIFYSELNTIFRKYFEYLGIHQASKMTLKELETKEINDDIFNLFKKSYLKEFSKTRDTKASRQVIIEDFEEILNK